MIMTEKKAAGIRCCGPEGCGDSSSRIIDGELVTGRWCVGSGCAAWRWAEPFTRHYQVAPNLNAQTESEAGREEPRGWEFCPAGDDPAGWLEPEADAHARRHGYCGLAGRPEIEP